MIPKDQSNESVAAAQGRNTDTIIVVDVHDVSKWMIHSFLSLPHMR
jgi:hypothetical protein